MSRLIFMDIATTSQVLHTSSIFHNVIEKGIRTFVPPNQIFKIEVNPQVQSKL